MSDAIVGEQCSINNMRVTGLYRFVQAGLIAVASVGLFHFDIVELEDPRVYVPLLIVAGLLIGDGVRNRINASARSSKLDASIEAEIDSYRRGALAS